VTSALLNDLAKKKVMAHIQEWVDRRLSR